MFPSFCRITGHSRNLPRSNYFPFLPPISPAEAKQFRTGCRITCNFNPNHNYQPITKLIEDTVVKCRITEKSVYEYKFFLQPCFDDNTESEKNESDEFFYYELDDKILVLPKSVERELNKGIIRDVQISKENTKIGFKYINRIKEYDLVSESTDKLKSLAPTKGMGLKKTVRKKRKKSALLGDLKSVFEQKERMAEIAVKKAMEKIQPDATKMELVKSKIISSKAPVYGYVDHNNKFTEISSHDQLPRHVTKGQMQNGVFTPGEYVNDMFIPGKVIDNNFTPGIIKDNEFVPGSVIDKEVDGKVQKKFIPGKVINGVFTPGQMIKTTDGSRSEFVPGQVLTLENNEKKFVPGLLIEYYVENDLLDYKFVPGKVEETNNTIKFTPGELIETNEGLKFICEKVFTEGSFEIQTFDNAYDFDLDDVKAAAHVCDTLLEFVKPDIGQTQSSFDQTDEDTHITNIEHTHIGSKSEHSISMTETQAAQTAETVNDTIQSHAYQVIQEICSEMNFSSEEAEKVTEKFLEEYAKQNLALGLSTEMKGDIPSGVSLVEQVCKKITEKTSSLVKQVFLEMGIANPPESGIFSIEKVVQKFVNSKVKQVILNSNQENSSKSSASKYKKVKEKTSSAIKEMCAQMNLSSEETEKVTDKLMEEFSKQETALGISGQMGIERLTDDALVDFIFQKVTEKTPSVINQMFKELNIQQDKKTAIASIEKSIGKIIKEEKDQEQGKLNQEKKGIVNIKKIKAQTLSAIKKICTTMNLSEEEAKKVTEKLLEEFSKQEDDLNVNGMESEADLKEIIFKKLTKKTSSIIKQVFKELNIQKDEKSTIESIENALEQISHDETKFQSTPKKKINYEKIKRKATSAVKQMCKDMNLTIEETKKVEERLMEELLQEEARIGISEQMELKSEGALVDVIWQKITEKTSSVVKQIFSELKIPRDSKEAMSSIEKVMGEIIQEEKKNISTSTPDINTNASVNYEKIKAETTSAIEKICTTMNLSVEETKKVTDRLMIEFSKQEVILGISKEMPTDNDLVDYICQEVTQNVPSMIKQVFSELNIKENETTAIDLIEKALEKVVQTEKNKSTTKVKDTINYEKVKVKTSSAIKQICKGMNLSPEETKKVTEKLMEEFSKQETMVGISNQIGQEMLTDGALIDYIYQEIKEKAPFVIKQVFKEMNIPMDEKTTISSIEKVMEQMVQQEEKNPSPNISTEKETLNYNKVKAKTSSAIKQICSGMNLSPEETKKIEEKLMEEFTKQEASLGISNQSTLADEELMKIICQRVKEKAPFVVNQVFKELNINKNEKSVAASIEMALEQILVQEEKIQTKPKLGDSMSYNKVKAKTSLAIKQICSGMNLTPEETNKVTQKLMEEFSNQEAMLGISGNSGIERLGDPSLIDFICQKVTEKAPSVINKVFSELNIKTNEKSTILSLENAMGLIFQEEKSLCHQIQTPTLKDTINFEKIQDNAYAAVKKICSDMNLTKQETEKMTQKVLQELSEEKMMRIVEQGENQNAPTALSISDYISQKVTEKAISVITQVASDMKIPKSGIPTTSSMQKAIHQIVHDEVIQSISKQLPSNSSVGINQEKAKNKASTIIQKVMSSNKVNPNVIEKLVLEFINEETLELLCNQNEFQMKPEALISRQAAQKAKTDSIIKKLSADMGLPQEQIKLALEQVLQEFSQPEVFKSICGEKTISMNGTPKKSITKKPSLNHKDSTDYQTWEDAIELRESGSTEKVLEDCKKLLMEGYKEEYVGKSEGKAADMLKDHVEDQLTSELNEATRGRMLLEAINLARVLNKMDVVKELESVCEHASSYETIVNDGEVLFILRQLVILKKLMAADSDDQMDLELNPELIRDAQILTEFAFANEERERYFTPPCDDIGMLNPKFFNNLQRQGVVYTEESSSFFSSEETMNAKRARLTKDDLEFDTIVEPVELLDSSYARHKIEMGRSRHQKKSKISLKSAEELQSTTSEQLAMINKETTLRELIETEEEFVRDLSFVIDNYYKALETGNMLAKYRELFGSLKPIYEFHQGILLEGLRYYVNEPKMIGRTFLRLERYFDNHAEYISEEEPNAQALLRDDKEISEYFEDLTISLGDEKTLGDHLKLPLQRINDYQLILQDLIDTQRILKEETVDLEKALDLLLAIPQKISDKKFLSNIEGFHGNVFHLGRLLRHDWFTITREDLEIKQRYAFLFKTRILLTKVRKISEERSVFILKDIIKLPEYTLEQVDENKFYLRGNNRVYTFESQAGNISNEWTDIINQSLQPDLVVAQRTEENIKQLKREGSLRRSYKTTSEQKRPSVAEITLSKPQISDEASKPSIERFIPITKAGVTIEEISTHEAETLDSKDISKETCAVVSVPQSPATGQEDQFTSKKQSSTVSIQEEKSTATVVIKDKTEQAKSTVTNDKGPTTEPSVNSQKSVESVDEKLPVIKQVKGRENKGSTNLNQLQKDKVEDIGISVGSEQKRKISTEVIDSSKSTEEQSPEEARKLRRRSSVIRRQSSVGMASEKPPVFSTPLRSIECEPGDNASFECTTEVPVIITWLKANRPLNDALADRVKITSQGNKHSLTLLNCRDEDGGLYTVKITDEKFGASTCCAVLTVHELTAEERKKKIQEKNSPQFLVKFKDTELLKDTRVSFMFVVKGKPEPTLTFYHDGMILQAEGERSKIIKHPDDMYEFCIDKISDDDGGEYTVKAENTHGTAEVAAKVRVVDEKDLFKSIEGKRLLNPGEEPQFDWFLNGRPFTPDEKLKVLFREDEDTLALIFQHVTPDDAGLYTCVAQTSGGKISCSAELTVQGAIHQLLKEPSPPTITLELTDTEVSVGGSAMMELKVNGFPKPQVSWYKNGKEELKAGGRFRFLYEDEESIALIIKSVTKEDAGLYVVKAVNDLGEAETKGQLIVKAPPRFVKKMVDMSCMTEEKLSMDVVVEGSPKPEIKWYKDGQLIIASEKIKFTELEDGRFQITIERVTLEDSGAYSVVASNAIGQMSEFWNLVAQQPAKIIRKYNNETTTELGSKGNQLNFSVQGVPEPTVSCSSSSGKQLKVDTLGGGEYRVNFDCIERENIKVKTEVKNEYGSDSCECQVNVRRSVKIVNKLKDLEIKEGEDATLKVKVDCYPKPNKVKWFIDGVEISGKKYETSDSGDEYALKIKEIERKQDSNKLNVQVKVENELGEDECSASITIKSKPKIKKGLDSVYRLVESSQNQELNVEVDSATFPEPKGTWYHNGVEVNADARIKITKKSSETYNLTINVIKYEDAGEWSFKAENEVGEVWSKTTVIVEGKPIFKKGLPEQVEVIESEKLELDVMVQDFCEENVKITWTLDSSIKLESTQVYDKSNNSAVSKIIFVPTAGCQKLTVTATNKHGETETRSELIHVNLNPPTIIKPLEKESFIKDGQKDVRIKVEIDGMPPPKITWLYNGEPIQQGSNELIIPVFSSANIGQYSVEASNVAGKVSTEGAIKMLQTRPTFTKGLEPSYEFKEGLEDLVLSVDVDGSPIPIVTWMKDGKEIDPASDPRVTITNADGKSTLRVKNIDPKDKGRYSVSLKNPNGTCESNTSVGIKPTPRAPLLLDPLEYPKDINKKAKLEIKTKVDGEPMPTIQFYHDGKPMSPNSWKVYPDGSVILTVDNVQPEDQGVYSIKLSNEVGEKKVDTEPINVHEPPQRPGIDPPLSSVKVVEGLPFSLKANVKGHPLPELSLEKDGVEIQDIKYDKVAKTFEFSKPKSATSDSGTYKLMAKNSEGKVESEGRVEVISRLKDGPKYEPKFLYELCDKSVDEGSELILFAKVDGNPLPEIRWEFNGSLVDPEKFPQSFDGENTTLRLPITERGNQGMYKCVLENEEGKAVSASNVTVNKVYKAPSFVQKCTDQEQIPACDCKFGAKISGIPTPTLKWFKDGKEITGGDKYKIKQEGDLVQLHVRDCDDSDKGIYTCQLTNKEGTAECKAKLDVVKERSNKPRGEIPYFLKTIGNTEVYPGMTAKFIACVGGYPDPEFEWFRNQTDKVFETDRIKIERDGAGSGLLRLIIKDVDIGDLADYTLRIWNQHGDAECSAYLKFDSLADLNKQKLGDLYSGFEDTRPTAIPTRPLITNMTDKWMTLKWNPCLPHVSRIPCTYLVEYCPVDQPDDWTTIYKGLKNNYCDIEFPNPKQDYKYRIRVQWGPHHVSDPSPYAITMRNKFDIRPPQWKPVLVPSIPRSYDLSRPPHEGYIHAPRFLNKEHDYQYAQLGHPSSVYYYVYGYPKPTLRFFKNGNEYKPEHTYLDNGLITIFINRMTDEGEGDYECEARNAHGIARQKVCMRRADHPRFISRPQEVYAMAHRGGKISARIYGIPLPDIKIYKDWHLLPLTSETRVRLQIIDIDQYTIDVFISIEETMTRDEGLYSIVATNVAGSIHSSAMIHVEESESDYYFLSNLKGRDVRFRNLNVRNYYDFGDEIGRGTQAIHHHVVEHSSGGSYTSKTMVTKYDPKRKDWVESEYNIWNGLNHRYISRLHDAFYHDDTYTFISDICTGGDIFSSLIIRESFTEYDICFFIRQLLEGLEYLHVQNHTAHLSLTPLDLLLTHINSEYLRIIDFGLARKNFNKPLIYGQPEYVSPEIVRGEKNVGPWSDMWAVGIITYVLLTGHSPFLGQNDRETLENVKNGTWSFGDRFDHISERAREFIKRLLVYDFKDRMDVKTSLDHTWFHLITEERQTLPNLQRDTHSSYYYKLKAWNENASCRGIYRRNPLETAYTDPTQMVYPPHYIEEDDYRLPIPKIDQLKLNGYPRPEADDFVSESHYQSGDETYLLQLRDTDFPARLRQYFKVAAHSSPSFQFNIYNTYCERNMPVIRERRKFIDVMDEEVDDEKKIRESNYSEGIYNSEPRRLKNEVGNRMDFQAEVDAYRSMNRDGREPIFREKPTGIVNVRLGQEVTLRVVVAGDPNPTVQWFKNDMMVLAPGENREIHDEECISKITFKEIRETDLAIYKIVARNKSGQIISRFRLRDLEDSREEPVPELKYDIETSPVNLSTEEIKVVNPIQLVCQGKFNSVILTENSRLLKVCTEQEYNTTKKLAHLNIFSVQLASQIGHSILSEDNTVTHSSACNLLQYISSLDIYSEQLLVKFVTQILDGLQYLHWQGIALLNLEPGNVIVYQNKKIKLADFSAAQPILKIGSRVDCLTDPQFTAPEVLNGEAQCMPQTDSWNVGLLIYILLSGVSPFLGETEEDTKQNVTYVRYHFEHLHKTVSQEATRFIMLIFKRSPLKRPTADECLEHRWFQLSDHMIKKREKSVFDTTKIKEYYANYLIHQKSKLDETTLQDFSSKYGTPT